MKNILCFLFAATLVSLQLCCGAPAIVGYEGDTPELRQFVKDAWYPMNVPDFEVIEVSDPEMHLACDHIGVDGCVSQSTHLIRLRVALAPERKLIIVLHEVGHLIRGNGEHLKCEGMTDIMCDAGAWRGTLPTERDMEFVK